MLLKSSVGRSIDKNDRHTGEPGQQKHGAWPWSWLSSACAKCIHVRYALVLECHPYKQFTTFEHSTRTSRSRQANNMTCKPQKHQQPKFINILKDFCVLFPGTSFFSQHWTNKVTKCSVIGQWMGKVMCIKFSDNYHIVCYAQRECFRCSELNRGQTVAEQSRHVAVNHLNREPVM